ncbi:flagellar type III secretion system pore protein FliP [Pseudomonas putida]|nr:flagellar type III secretion system pore protein FliP [Pseudomonas putida]
MMSNYLNQHKRTLAISTLLLGLGLCLPSVADAAGTLTALTTKNTGNGTQEWSLSMQTLMFLTSLTFLPAVLLMMTAFTRIIIVLSLLRTAMGTQSVPPNQVLLGLSLFLTFFVMSPVLNKAHEQAWVPFSQDKINFEQFVDKGMVPFREFMLAQTRETDIARFAEIAKIKDLETPDDVPMQVLVPAFAISEIKTAFQVGFTIFIPFLIIDLVVASVLMALGMMMVPPATISLPFKLMLFILADGWNLLIGSLANSFYM